MTLDYYDNHNNLECGKPHRINDPVSSTNKLQGTKGGKLKD
jgi:hypothetical protein